MTRTTAAFALVALATLAACGSKEPPTPELGAASSSASAKPVPMASVKTITPTGTTSAATAASAVAPAMAGPKWLADVAPQAILAKPGDRVWALAPTGAGDGAAFNIAEIDSVQGQMVTLASLARGTAGLGLVRDDKAAKRAGIPGGLLAPAAAVDGSKIKTDDFIIAMIPGGRTTVGHVTSVANKLANFKFANGEKVDDEKAQYAAPLGKGIAPFAYVAVKSGTGYKEGLVAAVVDDKVFAIDETGAVLEAPKADVKPLDLQWKERKTGDKVTVFDASGSSEAVIDKMSVAKWIFLVKVGTASKRVPFYAVFDKI
ncbi:MAG: hypothetical protein ABJE95_38165 [Byssovorax sp.]